MRISYVIDFIVIYNQIINWLYAVIIFKEIIIQPEIEGNFIQNICKIKPVAGILQLVLTLAILPNSRCFCSDAILETITGNPKGDPMSNKSVNFDISKHEILVHRRL